MVAQHDDQEACNLCNDRACFVDVVLIELDCYLVIKDALLVGILCQLKAQQLVHRRAKYLVASQWNERCKCTITDTCAQEDDIEGSHRLASIEVRGELNLCKAHDREKKETGERKRVLRIEEVCLSDQLDRKSANKD